MLIGLAIYAMVVFITLITQLENSKINGVTFDVVLRRAIFWFIYLPAYIIDFKMEQ